MNDVSGLHTGDRAPVLGRRAFLGAVAATGSAALLAACGSSSGSGSTGGSKKVAPLKISLSSPPTYFQYTYVNNFKAAVEAATDGSVTVQLFPNSQLAAEPDAIKGMTLGTITGYAGTTGSAESLVPSLGILGLPYLFDSVDHYARVMAGSLGTQLASDLDAKGIHLLGWWTGGVRDLLNNQHEVHEPADVKGMKMRVLQSPSSIATWKAYGAIPTPIASTDQYLALQTGTVAAAETALAANEALYPVVKYISLTHHEYTPAILACAKSWWNKLDKNQQAAVTEAATKVTPDELSADSAALTKSTQDAQDKHITVVTPDRGAFQKIAEAQWPQFAGPFGGMSAINVIRSAAS